MSASSDTAPRPRRGLPARVLRAVTGPWTWRNLASWAGLLAVLLLVKACLLDQYAVPTPSMEPTIHGDPRFLRGDRVLVNKAAFGLRIPFTSHYVLEWGAPKRWDIVVFRNPGAGSPDRVLVKRVAGLPGERVLIKDGGVTVNGEPVPFPEGMPDSTYYVNAVELQLMMHLPEVEQNPEQRAFLKEVWERYPIRYGSEVAPGQPPPEDHYLVPPDSYFMLGDNSVSAGQFSVDGRVWGWAPRDHLLGRGIGIWWPWPRRRDFTGWTRTWWGLTLLWGIPAILLMHETAGIIRRRRRRNRASAAE